MLAGSDGDDDPYSVNWRAKYQQAKVTAALPDTALSCGH